MHTESVGTTARCYDKESVGRPKGGGAGTLSHGNMPLRNTAVTQPWSATQAPPTPKSPPREREQTPPREREQTPPIPPMPQASRSHRLVLEEGGKTYLSGVREIVHFDEQSVWLALIDRRLAIDGENLSIEGFCRESGEVTVNGYVTALNYYDDRRGGHNSRKGGLLGRWFSHEE